jgi:hypothetical protein
MIRDVQYDPDLDFLPIPNPGSRSRGQKGTGSQIRIRKTGKMYYHLTFQEVLFIFTFSFLMLRYKFGMTVSDKPFQIWAGFGKLISSKIEEGRGFTEFPCLQQQQLSLHLIESWICFHVYIKINKGNTEYFVQLRLFLFLRSFVIITSTYDTKK